jgi:hypothetical protein
MAYMAYSILWRNVPGDEQIKSLFAYLEKNNCLCLFETKKGESN